MKGIPVDPMAILKVVDRLVSAYERSCEIELEKEKVQAQFELGMRKMDIEEKELNAKFRAAMRVIDLEEKKLDACIREMDTKLTLTEKYLENTIVYTDRLMKCICETHDEAKREQMQKTWLKFHDAMASILTSSSEGFNRLLSSGGQNLLGAASLVKGSQRSSRKELPLEDD